MLRLTEDGAVRWKLQLISFLSIFFFSSPIREGRKKNDISKDICLIHVILKSNASSFCIGMLSRESCFQNSFSW